MITQEELSKVMSGEKDVFQMSNGEFKDLLEGLSAMFFARIMNCIDPTGGKDREWGVLAAICRRASGRSVPLHNYDVGTLEEQKERMHQFCLKNGAELVDGGYLCENCPLLHEDRCELAWAHMPYDAEEVK